MKIASMLNDVFVSLFKRPFTELYPYAVKDAPARLRGKLEWDEEKCKGCMLCVRDCPAKAIEIEKAAPAAPAASAAQPAQSASAAETPAGAAPAPRRYVFHYRLDRCIYCAQCVVSCKEGALAMSSTHYHLASADRSTFTEVYGARGAGECREKDTPT